MNYQELRRKFDEYYKLATKAREEEDYYSLYNNLMRAGQCQLDMSTCAPESQRYGHAERGRALIGNAKAWKEAKPQFFENVKQNGDGGKTSFEPNASQETTFDSIIGCEDIKDFVRKQYVKRFDKKYSAVFSGGRGGAMERGILLYGLPGTGKTMIARGIANELSQAGSVDVAFYSVKACDLKDRYVGETEKKINALYEKAAKHANAKENALSVIFIDEIETLIPSRTSEKTESYDSSAVAEFLRVLDGFEKEKVQRVITIGASNFPNRIDEAALRTGRIGKWFRVDIPDKSLRESLIRSKFGKVYKIEKDVLGFAVQKSAGYSSADVVMACERIKSELTDKGFAAVDKGLAEDEVIKISSTVTRQIVEKVLKSNGSTISLRSVEALAQFEKDYNIQNSNGPIVDYMKKLK